MSGGVNRQAWHNDGVDALTAGPDGDIYVVGSTTSDTLPATPRAVQSCRAGNTDGFVLRLGFSRSDNAPAVGAAAENRR